MRDRLEGEEGLRILVVSDGRCTHVDETNPASAGTGGRSRKVCPASGGSAT